MVQWKAAARRRCYCYLGCLHSRTPDYGVGASEVLLASAHPFPLIHVEGEVHMLPSCYGEASWSTVSGDEERHCGEGRCTMDARPPRVLCSLLAGEERRCGEGRCTMDARPPPSPVLPPRWSVWGEDV